MTDGSSALAALLLQDAARFDAAGKSLASHSIDIPIVGHSMHPALTDGTIVHVSLGDGASCREGDVAIFRMDAQIVAHRVVHRGRRHLIMRGDARIAPDPPVPFGRVLGKMSERPPLSYRRKVARLAETMIVLALHVHPSIAAFLARVLIGLERWHSSAR